MNSNIRGWIDEGNSFFDEGKFQNAISCYDKIIEKEPKNLSAWLNKGASLSELGKLEEAIVCYDKVLDLTPQETGALFSKGNSLFELGRLNEAVVCFDKALEIEPQNILILTNKFEALFRLGLLVEAGFVQHEIDKLKERQAKILIKKGLKHFNLSKFEDSLTCFAESAELCPNQTCEWLNKWFENDANFNKILEATNPKVRELIKSILHLAKGLKNYPKTSLTAVSLATLFSENGKITIEDLKGNSSLIEIFKDEFVRDYTNDDYSEKCFDEIFEILSKALNASVERYDQLESKLSNFWTRLKEIDDSLSPMTSLASKLQLDENRSDEESLIMFHSYCYTYLVSYEALFVDVIKNLFAFLETSNDKAPNILNLNDYLTKGEEFWALRHLFKKMFQIEPVFLEPVLAQERMDIRNSIAHGQAFFESQKMRITFKCQKVDKSSRTFTFKTIQMSLLDFLQKWLDVSDVIDSFRYISMIIDIEKLLASATFLS